MLKKEQIEALEELIRETGGLDGITPKGGDSDGTVRRVPRGRAPALHGKDQRDDPECAGDAGKGRAKVSPNRTSVGQETKAGIDTTGEMTIE